MRRAHDGFILRSGTADLIRGNAGRNKERGTELKSCYPVDGGPQ
jgi:hypothetical protein